MIEIITTKVKPFPKLMKDKRNVVYFFTEPKKGLLIATGIWNEEWDMELFEDYNEVLTIKNK